MRELENSTVRYDVRPWEWGRFEDDENEDEEAEDYEDADE